MVKRLAESGDMGNFGKGKFIPRPGKKRTQSGVGSYADTKTIKKFFENDFMDYVFGFVCRYYLDDCDGVADDYFDCKTDIGTEDGVDYVNVTYRVKHMSPFQVLYDIIIPKILKAQFNDRIKIDRYTELIPDYDYITTDGRDIILVFDIKRMDSLDSDSEKLPYQRFESYRRNRRRYRR